mgnify:CR=1 FL=1
MTGVENGDMSIVWNIKRTAQSEDLRCSLKAEYRKVAYALYYGALYYGYPCRYEPYSTGDWQMDYFVTQVAVHILNGEFTLAAARNGMDKSNATTAEKNLAYDRISKIVAAANETSNYGGFTADGWLDMESCTFSLNGYNNSWSLQNGRYLSGGKFHGNFQSYYGYDFREQLTGYEISAPQGVQIEKNGNQTYADFQAAIPQAQYRKWQLTGMQIPITVTASLPRYWVEESIKAIQLQISRASVC